MAKYYKLVGGKHQEGSGGDTVLYKEGDVIRSDEPLDKKFVGKFVSATGDEIRAAKKAKIKEERRKAREQEEDEELEAKAAKAAAEEADEELDEEEEEEEEAEENALGDDVTDEFDGAEDANLKIFKTGRHYTVASADSPDKAVRGGKELTKKDARAYVAKHAPQEDEEEAETEATDEE